MAEQIFKTGDLGLDKHHAVTEISKTKKGLKIDYYSVDWDKDNFTYYIECNDLYNYNTLWTQDKCDRLIEHLQMLTAGNPDVKPIKIYRTIKY